MPTTHGAALVSGASRGLGAVIARRLAADGWPVAVNYRSELERDEAGHVVEDILARGGTAEAFAADITDEAAAAGLVSRATDQLGSIDVLVVNATGPRPVVPLEELSWQDHLDQLLFFVKSPTLLVQAAPRPTACVAIATRCRSAGWECRTTSPGPCRSSRPTQHPSSPASG